MKEIEEMESDDTTNAFAFVALILGLASVVLGLTHVSNQPFTDTELENFVDTWEPEVFGGLFLMALLCLGAIVCSVVAWCARSLPRKLFGAACLAFVAALVLEVAALNILTARAEKAAGHSLSWWPLG